MLKDEKLYEWGECSWEVLNGGGESGEGMRS